MDEKEKLNRDRKVLQDYYNDLQEKFLNNLEYYNHSGSLIKERAVSFSQFLTSTFAAVLAVLFGVKSFNELIVSHLIFNSSLIIYIISFFIFISVSRERIDYDALKLDESYKKSKDDFNESYLVLDKQLKNGINLEIFYKEIEDLLKSNQEEKNKLENKEKQNVPDYFLEFCIFTMMVVLWLVFLSICPINIYLNILGILCILHITHNQNFNITKMINKYNILMSKLFPLKQK